MNARIRNICLLLIVLVSVVFTIPNFLPRTTLLSLPQFFQTYQFQLGLDLQGGSMLVLEVDEGVVRRDYIKSLEEQTRQVLRSNRIYYSNITRTNDSIKVAVEPSTPAEKVVNALRSIDSNNNLAVSRNNNIYSLDITESAFEKRKTDTLVQSIEIVRNRVDQSGTKEPVIQRQGDNRIAVELPGVEDPERIKELLGKTAKMSFHLVSNDSSGVSMPGIDGISYQVSREPVMQGDNLDDAQVTFETNSPVVSFRLNSVGAKRFGEITSQNTGKQLAIVMDNQVISAPRINQAIMGGSGIITGNFTTKEAQDLALLMRAGSLPAPLYVVEERTVGPTLGSDSIRAGTISTLLGLFAVCIFMGIFYRTLGIVANISLILNFFIIGALMSLFGSTLTLPGIAGIVLTLGMAVDANVLIYEGMYMEKQVNNGSTLGVIKSSFDRVFSTIIDSNLTTFLAALFLYQFGSGPIRGFAVTLTIGLVASVISALMFSRTLIEFLAKFNLINLSRKLLFAHTKIDFMKYHKIAFLVTGLIVIASFISFFYPGPNLGIDFKGGVSLEMQVAQSHTIGDLRLELTKVDLNDLSIKSSSENTYEIRFKALNNEDAQNEIAKIKETVWKDSKILSINFVGPSVSKDLLRNGIYAIMFSLLSIMVYLWFRFEWQFGLAGVIALMHDIVVTGFVVVITRTDFNLNTIAALMTIAGYSINDTVVIFDQIRRNIRENPDRTIREHINVSINEALRRTINTSLTVVLVVLMLFIFGGEALRSLSFTLLVGVTLGVYSTIFIATPMLIYFGVGNIANKKKDKNIAKTTEGYGDFEHLYEDKKGKL